MTNTLGQDGGRLVMAVVDYAGPHHPCTPPPQGFAFYLQHYSQPSDNGKRPGGIACVRLLKEELQADSPVRLLQFDCFLLPCIVPCRLMVELCDGGRQVLSLGPSCIFLLGGCSHRGREADGLPSRRQEANQLGEASCALTCRRRGPHAAAHAVYRGPLAAAHAV